MNGKKIGKVRALRAGDRIRLVRAFKNGKGDVFHPGTLGVVQNLKSPQPHLVFVRLDGYTHDILPFRAFVEPV